MVRKMLCRIVCLLSGFFLLYICLGLVLALENGTGAVSRVADCLCILGTAVSGSLLIVKAVLISNGLKPH